MGSKIVSKEIHLQKANSYLNGLQRSLEQAGGLNSLWSERTARMNSTELLRLGSKLGITEKGEYAPLVASSSVVEKIQNVLSDESLKSFHSQAHKLTGEAIGFEQLVDGVWFDYAYHVVENEGLDCVPPTPEQLKQNFVNGNYDEALTQNYAMLREPETNLLLSCRSLELSISQPFADMGPMK